MLSNIPKEGIKPTHLANRALVDYEIALKHLRELESEGFVIVDSKVHITEKGKAFLEQYKKLISLVKI